LRFSLCGVLAFPSFLSPHLFMPRKFQMLEGSLFLLLFVVTRNSALRPSVFNYPDQRSLFSLPPTSASPPPLPLDAVLAKDPTRSSLTSDNTSFYPTLIVLTRGRSRPCRNSFCPCFISICSFSLPSRFRGTRIEFLFGSCPE